MIHRAIVVFAVIVVAISVVALGCGSDEESTNTDDSSTIATSSLSKKQFLKQAVAACGRERRDILGKITAYLEKHESNGLPQPVLIANMAKDVLVPTIEAEIAVLRKLGAPAGDEEQIEAMLAAQEAGVDQVKKLKRASSTEAIEDHFIEASKQYWGYGFTACVNSPKPGA